MRPATKTVIFLKDYKEGPRLFKEGQHIRMIPDHADRLLRHGIVKLPERRYKKAANA